MSRSIPTLLSVALLLSTGFAHAATPASGELTETSGPLSFTGGPYLISNPTGIEAGVPPGGYNCDVPMSCDDYALKVTIADKFRNDKKNEKEVVQVVMNFAGPAPQLTAQTDLDLYLVDSAGKEVGSSHAGQGVTPETINVPLKTLKDGNYTVRIVTGVPLDSTANVDIHIGKKAKAGEALPLSCSLPGVVLALDAKGDANPGPVTTTAGIVPDPIAADDILEVDVAEPDTLPGLVAFTLKTAGLAQVPPQTRWMIYFDLPDGSSWYAAMSTSNLGSEVAPIFEYGTIGSVGTPSPAPNPGTYVKKGTLDKASGFNADGTITLVLDPAAVGLKVGDTLTNILGKTRRSTTAETMNVGLTVDDTVVADTSVKYTLVGNAPCAKAKAADAAAVSGKEGSGLALGAFGLPALLSLSSLVLIRRRV